MTNELPTWLCPTCDIGILEGNINDFRIFENSSTLKQQNEIWFETEWIKGVFDAVLTCNNSRCLEKVVLSGDMQFEEGPEYNEFGQKIGYTFYERLTPKFFNPAVDLFKIHISVPEVIKDKIKESFALFWLDSYSCANKIRTVVELIMNQQKIKKTFLNKKGKREQYKLHQRIEFFQLVNPNEAEHLMAIKWIGNSGSHASKTELQKEHLIHAFKILELVTKKIYEKETKFLNNLSKRINKAKKPVSK